MSILGRITGGMPFRGQRASAQPAPQATKKGPPPVPGQPRKKPSGPPPPISTKSQADKDKEAIQMKASDIRMKGDQMRMSGGHRSADTYYRQADEIESRLKQGAPQLDDKAMSKIRPSDHLRDNPGSGWGRY